MACHLPVSIKRVRCRMPPAPVTSCCGGSHISHRLSYPTLPGLDFTRVYSKVHSNNVQSKACNIKGKVSGASPLSSIISILLLPSDWETPFWPLLALRASSVEIPRSLLLLRMAHYTSGKKEDIFKEASLKSPSFVFKEASVKSTRFVRNL